MFSSKKLTGYRESRGLSRNALARLADVSHVYIRNLEERKTDRPKKPELERVARALGIEPRDLMEPDEDPEEPEELRAAHRILRMVPRERLEVFEEFVRDWAFSPVDDQRLVYEFQRVLKIHREHAVPHTRKTPRLQMIAEEEEEVYETK